jgi:hypothetical protein
MFKSQTYFAMFEELVRGVQDEGLIFRDWSSVGLTKWHILQGVELNSTEEKVKYSRAYVTELAAQYREAEFLLRMHFKGFGAQFQIGFSTDISESCVWITPFFKPSDDMSDLRYQIILN